MASYSLDDIADAPAAPQRPAGRATGRSFALDDILNPGPGPLNTQAAPSAQADAYVEDGMPAIMPPVPAGQQRHEAPRHDPDPQFPPPRGEFRKGFDAGVAGGKQMAAAAATIPFVGVDRQTREMLAAFDEIDHGSDAPLRKRRAPTGMADPIGQQARLYFDASPEERAALRRSTTDALASNKAFRDGIVEAWRRYGDEAKASQGKTVNFTDIRDLEGFKNWFAYNTGQGIPYLAASALSGIIGGALGGPAGAAVGVGASGYGMGVGDIQSELMEKGIADRPDVAMAGAVPYAALDFLGPVGRTLRNLSRPVIEGVARNYFQRLGREIPANLVEEFINEAGQEIVKDAAVTSQTGEKFLTDESLLRWFNSGMAGAASAGPASVVSAAPGGQAAQPRQQAPFQAPQPIQQQGEAPDVSRETLPVGTTEAPLVAAPGGTPPTAAPAPPIAGVTPPIDSGQGQPPVSSAPPAASGPAPGTPADFEAAMNDPRPLAEVMAERGIIRPEGRADGVEKSASGIQRVAKDDRQMREDDGQDLRTLRGEGDSRLPQMEREFRGLLVRDGAKADPASLDRQDRRDEGVFRSELPMGDAGTPSPEQAGIRPRFDPRGTDDDRRGVGARDRDSADDTVQSGSDRLAHRTGLDPASESRRSQERDLADARRQDGDPLEFGPGARPSPQDIERAAQARGLTGTGAPSSPIRAATADDVNLAAARTLADPSPAQKESGVYRKGHVKIGPFEIAIETPRGGTRTGMDAEGRPWSNPDYPAHYGYLKAGRDTGDGKVDVFVGDEPASRLVYVIDQIDPKTGKFDEPKVMIGFANGPDAQATYEVSYNDGSGEARMGAITPMTVAEFQAWLKGGDPTKPLAYVQPPPPRSFAPSDVAPAPPAPAQSVPPPGGQAAAPGLVSGPPVPTPAPVATPDQVANRTASARGVTLTPAERLDMVELMVDGTDPELALEIALTRSGLDVAMEAAEIIEQEASDAERQAEPAAPDAGGADRTVEVAADEGASAERAAGEPAAENAPSGAQLAGAEQAEGQGVGTVVAVRTETTPAAPLTLRVGDRTYPVESVEEASRIFVAARDKFGEGASNTPTPLLVRDGKVIGYVSYNGRVWAGLPTDRNVDKAPIYDPLPPPEKPAEAATADLPAPKVDAPRQRALSAKEKRAEAERKKRDAAITRREAAKKAIQTRKANAGALNIVQTIAAAGGIKDTSGDLRAIMGRPNYMVPVYGALRNDRSGMDPDRAREMLVEAGFLPEGATLNDLYEAIDQTVRGKPVMSARDVNAQLDRAEERKAAKYGDEPRTEPKVMTFDEFSASNGVSSFAPQDAGLHRTPGGMSKPARKAALDRAASEMAKWQQKRDSLRREYAAAIARGEIREPTQDERLTAAAAGPDDSPKAQAARRVLEKRRERAEGSQRFQRPRIEKIAVAKDSLSDEQMVIPGAERVAAEGRKAAKAPQRSVAETPLFGGAQDATRDVKRADAERDTKRQGRLFRPGDNARLRVAGAIDATVNLSPQDQARRDATLRALNVTLRRMAGKAAPSASVFDRMMVGDQEILGVYSPADHLLALSMRSPDPIGTVRHETIHVLRNTGLIDDAAWSALSQAAERDGWLAKHAIDERWGDGLTREQALEEAIAEEFGVGLREGVWKTGNAKVDAIFQRIAEFLRRVRAEVKRALAAGGMRGMSDADVAELVFSLIERGAFREGEITARVQQDAMAQVGDEDAPLYQMAQTGAQQAAARPESQRRSFLGTAIAALKGGDLNDPRAKVQEPHDIGLARKLLITPRTIGAYFPEFARVFRAGVRQFRARDMMISDFTEMARGYMELPQESKEKINKVLEHGRMAGETYAPAADGTITVKNKVGGVGERVDKDAGSIAAEVDVIRQTDKAWLLKQDGIQAAWVPKSVATKNPDGKFIIPNWLAKQHGFSGEKITRESMGATALTKLGETVTLTPDEARAYRAYRATMDAALDRFRDQVLREWGYDPADAATPRDAQAVEEIAKDTENAGERARLKTLVDVLSNIERAKKTGYVPFTRYGSHYVTVTSLQDGKRVVVHREHIEPGITTSPRTKLTRARLEQEGARLRKRLAEIYPPDRGFEISELREVTPDSLDDLPSFSDLDAIIGAANLPPEQSAKVMEAVGELIKKRGFRAHFIKSRNIPGYSTDLERSLADYIVGISGYLARREHMPEIEEAIAGIPAREPKLREYAKKWNDYIQNPSEELQPLRQAGFLMYLGGRISSALVNLSQIPVVTMPWLSMFSNPVAANAQIARAYKDVGMAIRPLPKSKGGAGLDVFDVEKLPEDVRDVVRAALKDGRLLPIETFDIMATARGRTPGARTIAAKTQYVKDGLAYAFQAAERTNRLVTFIAAYRLAQNPEVMRKINETLRKDGQWTEFRKERQRTPEDFATFSVEETQFMQGKINRSGVMRGPGTAIFQFKSFMLNYLELLARLGFFGAGSYRGGARFATMAGLMGMLVLTSGLMGLPGAEDGIEILEAIVKYFTGVDPQFERRIRDAGGWLAAAIVAALGADEETQETARDVGKRVLARGPLRETGIDISQRVGQGRVAPQPTGGQFDPFWERAAGLLGIPASLALRIPATLTNLWEGDWLAAGISASPEFIADPLRALQFATEGVKTRARGQLVMPPDEVLPDGTTVGGASNVAKRALGFQPTGNSRAREEMWAVQRAGNAANAIRAKFNLARAKAAAAVARAAARGDVQAQRLAEARLSALVERIVSYNASASPADRYDFNSPGYDEQLKSEMRGRRSGIDRKMPKRGREELPAIRSAY